MEVSTTSIRDLDNNVGRIIMKMSVGESASKFLSEDNGNFSSMRLLVVVVILVVLFNWTYYNVANNVLSSFSWEDIFVVVGPLLAKAYQKGKENPVKE